MPTKIPVSKSIPGRAQRNLGTFSTTYMDNEAKDVFLNYAAVNAVDNHAYPELEHIKRLCADFLLKQFHADVQHVRYFTTSGSSESVFLALLAMKKQWQDSMKNRKPNFIIGTNSHISWQKAATYLEIELRIAPTHGLNTLDNEDVMDLVDANTIGVCCTLGAPTTLLCDDIESLNHKLTCYHQSSGHFIPIHVDAASGGFVFPFIEARMPFDFTLNHVASINVSSHKYGLVYPSLGWLFIRNQPVLDTLLDESDYLGTIIKRFSMQFSHSAAQLMTQYHHIQTLGEKGYQRMINTQFYLTEQLKQGFARLDVPFRFIESQQPSLPGLVFSIQEADMITLAQKLREKNWYLPVYWMKNKTTETHVARIVMRHGFNEALIQELMDDFLDSLKKSVVKPKGHVSIKPIVTRLKPCVSGNVTC